MQAVNYFYSRVKALYGSKYKALFPSEADEQLSKREWGGQVMNMSPEDIDRGIGKLKEKIVADEKDFRWPNIPLIAALCHPQPEDFGLPTLDAAWLEAQHHAYHVDKHRWTHEAVRIAGKRTCWFDIMSAVSKSRQESLKERFAQHYEYLTERVMENKPLEGGTQRLESDSHKSKKSLAEQSHDYHTHQHEKIMTTMGINPKGGRAEFLKYLQGAQGEQGEK